MSIKLGETIYFGFVTSRADTGAIADATGTPAVAVYENGGAAVSGASVTKRAATTGQYVVEVVATSGNDFEAGKSYEVVVTATVNAVAGGGSIATFMVRAASEDDLATAAALTTVQADTDDIQTRLPAALVSGRMDSSVGAMATGVMTAAALAADAATEIAAAVWDRLTSALTAVGSVGALVVAKLGLISSGSVTTSGPVLTSGDIALVKGDDYLASDGNALSWTSPTLIGLSVTEVTLILVHRASGAVPLTITGAATSWDGALGRATVDMTTAQSATLLDGDDIYDGFVELTLATGSKRTPWAGLHVTVRRGGN